MASLCVFAPHADAQPPTRYPPPESLSHAPAIAKARSVVRGMVDTMQLPGLSVVVLRGDKMLWSESFGIADLEQGLLVTPQTRFRIGSVSKLLTAAGVARLVEQGKLDLDAPVQLYVPDFPRKPWPVTTRQLAGHVAGIRHYGANYDGLGPPGAPHFASVTAGLTLFQNDPLLFEPGTSYSYSSYGWNLISAVIEGAAKQEFLQYMQSAVLEPLGLRSIAADHPFTFVPNRTRFFERDRAGRLWHAPYVDFSYKWASGGFLSNAEDLARFGAAHLKPGFLRQETLNEVFTSQRLASGKDTGVGIGWRIGTDAKGRRVFHHGGASVGGRAMLMMYPDLNLVVAMVANIRANFGEEHAQAIGELFMR
jgi:CubicO group peptidase (beta-lactamase class C family)